MRAVEANVIALAGDLFGLLLLKGVKSLTQIRLEVLDFADMSVQLLEKRFVALLLL
jgi:hypothetical protein